MATRYYDIQHILNKGLTFNIIIGGRGIGKTYSALHKMFVESESNVLYVRSSQIELDVAASEEGNPLKVINRDFKRDFHIIGGKIKKIVEALEYDANGKIKKAKTRGYAGAMTTFSNMRGVDFSDCEWILWDEFIPEQRAHGIKITSTMFYNLYETVNRNREIQGKEPVKVIMLSNAVSIASDLLKELNLVGIIERMLRKERKLWSDRKRSILIELPDDDDFKEEKMATVLYRLSYGTDYYKHAIDNKFAYDSWYNVKTYPITEYIPVCAYEDVYIYKHKSNGTYYATCIRADCPTFKNDTYISFKRNYWILLNEMLAVDRLYFDSMYTKKTLLPLIT